MAAQSFLLTRPAAASARFATALRQAFGDGIDVVISPLMAPAFMTPPLPKGPFDAVILTSETGAEAARRISAERGGVPVTAYCVGDRTAQVAAEAGFVPISAGGDADALVALIRATAPDARLLHLRGADSRGDVAEKLCSGGTETQEAVVYAQIPCPLVPAAARLLAAAQPVIVPLFSPRSADLLAGTGPIRAPLWIAALSPAVAARATALHPERLEIAAHPEAEALLRAVECLRVAGRQA